MQIMFFFFFLKDKFIENLVFGKSGLISIVFEKLFIWHSCILFIKQCALKSFCIKMFFKNLFFLDFRSIEPVAWPIENVIKIMVWICLARLMLDRSKLIFDRSNLIFDILKFVLWVFKKIFSQVFFTLFKSFQKLFDCSCSTDPIWAYFVVLFLIFLRYLCLQVQVRPFYPYFFSLFTIFMHFYWNFWT